MKYEKNYRNQFFKDDNGPIDFKQMFSWDNLKKWSTGPKHPGTRLGKKVLKTFLIIFPFVLIGTGAAFFTTNSAAFAVIIFMGLFFTMCGVLLLVTSIDMFVTTPKLCSEKVNALCIGHSYSTGNNDSTPGGGILICPVFQYEYEGREYTAYDAVYENHTVVPNVGGRVSISINPNDPEELVWYDKSGRKVFLWGFTIAAFAMGLFLIYISFAQKDIRETKVSSETKIEYKI